MEIIFGRILFIMFGIILLISAIYGRKRRKNFLENGVRTDATIVSIEKDVSTSVHGGSSWFTKIKYEVGGNIIKTNYTETIIKPKYTIGEIVQVLYDKERPEQNLPVNTSRGHILFFVLFILGVALILIGLLA